MKLRNSFFTIDAKTVSGETVRYDLSLNSRHVIYAAHFPERKITPGVCLLQIAEELEEDHLQKDMELVGVKNVKFLAVVSPDETPHITYFFSRIQQEGEKVHAQVSVESGDKVFAKLSFTTQCK